MKVEFVADTGAAEIVALLVHEGRVFSGDTAGYDTASSGALTKAMKASRFTGGALSHLAVAAPAGVDAGQVLLVGAGDEATLDEWELFSQSETAWREHYVRPPPPSGARRATSRSTSAFDAGFAMPRMRLAIASLLTSMLRAGWGCGCGTCGGVD